LLHARALESCFKKSSAPLPPTPFTCVIPQARANGADTTTLFEHFDVDGSKGNGDGEIDMAELSDGLERLGIYTTHAESAGLLAMFNGGRGCISFREFENALKFEGLPVAERHVHKIEERATETEEEEAEEEEFKIVGAFNDEQFSVSSLCFSRLPTFSFIPAPPFAQIALQRIHEKLNIQARIKNGKPTTRPQYRDIFNSFDKDGTGIVDKVEMGTGLQSFGVNLFEFTIRGWANSLSLSRPSFFWFVQLAFDDDQLAQILTAFDPKGTGLINKREFIGKL